MTDWNPQAYLAFADERLRPAQDLLARVPPGPCEVIFDLGCGPGNSTALLHAAWPAARITGVDSSPAMLAKARDVVPAATFIEADVTAFAPPEADLIYSNALFQWIPGHVAVWTRLLSAMKPGAILAVQMPDNLNEPSHALMRDVASLPQFEAKLKGRETVRARIELPRTYHDALAPFASRIDIWRTEYNHIVTAASGIADFFASTGLKRYLDALEETDARAFRALYEERLVKAYPPLKDGRVMFALPRIFIVAQR
ncbi:MAG: trans-aconitate 2-methyltransferase [Proteobacteria bacterium]|nr:trans-aconitate 2-methyltransferase [Pseudomonadota bacterium]